MHSIRRQSSRALLNFAVKWLCVALGGVLLFASPGAVAQDPAERLTVEIDLLELAGDYPGARKSAEQQLALRRQALGGDHSLVAASLMRLAEVGNYAGSECPVEELLREALAIRRRNLGAGDPDLALTMSALVIHGGTSIAEGDALAREALAIGRARPDAPLARVRGLQAQGVQFFAAHGEYIAAEALLREAVALCYTALGPEALETALAHERLADCLHGKGDFPAAEEEILAGLAILERRLNPNHTRVVEAYNHLGLINIPLQRQAEAERWLREAQSRYRSMGFEYPSLLASILHNLGVVIKNRGLIDESELLFQQVHDLRVGAGVPVGSAHYYHLGEIRYFRGDFAGADSLQARVVAMLQQSHEPEAAPLLKHLWHLGRIRIVNGCYADAESILVSVAAAFETARLRRGLGLSRARTQANPYELLAVALLMRAKPDQAWQALERGRGRTLADALLARDRRAWLAAGPPLGIAELRRSLSLAAAAGVADTTAALRSLLDGARAELLAARADWAALQDEIMRQTAQLQGEVFDLARVQAALGPDEAIVSWLSSDLFHTGEELLAWGNVIRSQGPVQWRRLCVIREPGPYRNTPLSVAAPSAPNLRKAISRRPKLPEAYVGLARDVWEERLAPLEHCLAGVRHLVVIPCDVMLGIPVEILPWGDSGERLGDRVLVTYAPSATIFTWLREKELAEERGAISQQARGGAPSAVTERPMCLVVADPTLRDSHGEPSHLAGPGDASAGDLALREGLFEHDAADSSALERREEDLLRSALAGNRAALGSLRRLPWARAEAEAIGRLFGDGASLLVGGDATLDTLVALEQSDQLRRFDCIHFATHALVDDQVPEHCALVLSQANLPDPLVALAAGRGAHNGCLLAEEIMDCWSIDADLVVLSGCGTALGARVPADGHMGLAHAFLLAGARSLVLSLWSVEDRATALLMQRFYANLLGAAGGTVAAHEACDHSSVRLGNLPSKAAALQEAKEWLRAWRDPEGRQPYLHPFYWSGFILMGSDR